MSAWIFADEMDEKEVGALSGRIESIVQGGLWRRPDVKGEARLVVTRFDYGQYASHCFYIQWLRREHSKMLESVDYTKVITELNGYVLLEAPRFFDQQKSDHHGEYFKLIAHPQGTRDDREFTITANSDFTYSIRSQSVEVLSPSVKIPLVTFAAGLLLGGLLVFRHLKNKEALALTKPRETSLVAPVKVTRVPPKKIEPPRISPPK